MTAVTDTRGEHLADGGFDPHTIGYPDPARIAAIHAEWAATDTTTEPATE